MAAKIHYGEKRYAKNIIPTKDITDSAVHPYVSEFMEKWGFPSDTFCALPWMHLSTRPNGHMRVCCTANASGVAVNADSGTKILSDAGVLRRDDGKPANLATTGLLEAWNNDYMRTVRLLMLEGKKPLSCTKCFKEEEAGHNSKRMWETRKWIQEIGLEEIIKDTEPDGSVKPKIRYIDLRLGSKCQLACVMCSPNDSSGWVKEHKEIFPTLESENLQSSMAWEKDTGRLAWAGGAYNWHKKNPSFWNELYEQIPTLKQLYWAGGEALIMDDHYTLLEKIIDEGYAGQIELRYNSNGLEWRDDLFELWSKFRNVIFHFSVDGIEERLEYIRYPSDWKHVEQQIHKLDNYPYDNLKLTSAFTVMALNIYHIPEYIKWKLTQNFKKFNTYPDGMGMISCHLAYWPPQLNLKALPPSMKKLVREKYEKDFFPWLEENWKLCTGVENADVTYEEWRNNEYGIKRLQGLLDFMDADDWSVRLPEMAEWCYKVAEHRNIDFDDTFPELFWLRDYYEND